MKTNSPQQRKQTAPKQRKKPSPKQTKKTSPKQRKKTSPENEDDLDHLTKKMKTTSHKKLRQYRLQNKDNITQRRTIYLKFMTAPHSNCLNSRLTIIRKYVKGGKPKCMYPKVSQNCPKMCEGFLNISSYVLIPCIPFPRHLS